MLQKRREEIANSQNQCTELENIESTIKKRKAEMKATIDLLDNIIQDGAISNTHIRMLIEKIVITKQDECLNIEICFKANFRRHYDMYNREGEIVDIALETAVGG